MKSPFVSSFQNSNIADFDRARAQALLEMKIRETADVGRARGYVREGKPFEAQVILSKYGALQKESPFDPLVARETAQRTKQLGNLQSQLSQELGFPDLIDDVKNIGEEISTGRKERSSKKAKKTSGKSEEQLIREQEEKFAAARNRTGSAISTITENPEKSFDVEEDDEDLDDEDDE
jgi:hypothetical protein